MADHDFFVKMKNELIEEGYEEDEILADIEKLKSKYSMSQILNLEEYVNGKEDMLLEAEIDSLVENIEPNELANIYSKWDDADRDDIWTYLRDNEELKNLYIDWLKNNGGIFPPSISKLTKEIKRKLSIDEVLEFSDNNDLGFEWLNDNQKEKNDYVNYLYKNNEEFSAYVYNYIDEKVHNNDSLLDTIFRNAVETLAEELDIFDSIIWWIINNK